MGSFDKWFDKNKFKEIFRTHWDLFKDSFSRYRAAIYDEAVHKMLGCGDPKNGYATYVCSCGGGDRKKVPFSCKSCFCLSCAKVYTDQWAARIEAILFSGVAYRHSVLIGTGWVKDLFLSRCQSVIWIDKSGHKVSGRYIEYSASKASAGWLYCCCTDPWQIRQL